jgi:hypothetical protein
VPILFAPFGGVLLGALLAWLARAELAREEGPLALSRPFAITALFAAFVYGPIVGYFAAFHGDWAYLYWIPSHAVPSAIDLALVLLATLTLPITFAVAARPARGQRLAVVGAIGGVPALLLAILVIALQRRLSTSASYAQFHGDFGTEAITASALGRGVLWMALVGLIGLAWCVWSIQAERRTAAVKRSRPRRTK